MRILSLFFTLFITSCIFVQSWVYADCDATSSASPSSFLRWCAAENPDNAISPGSGNDGTVAVKQLVTNISKRVIELGALFAIGAIVFSGIQYTTSYGDDEKIKKAKTTGIYAVIWILLLLVAFPLVDIVINFVYSLSA